jgi:hypothetical protein
MESHAVGAASLRMIAPAAVPATDSRDAQIELPGVV